MRNLGKRFWPAHGAGLLLAVLMLASVVWAEQMEMSQYYMFPPITITDPFHLQRITIGNGYMTINNPPANPDSAIIEGSLRVGPGYVAGAVTNSSVEIAPPAGGNASLRWLAGANQGFFLENNAGTGILQTQDAPGGGFTEKGRILNNGKVGLMGAAPVAATGSSLEIGTLVGNSSVRWLAGANQGFFLENNAGTAVLQTQDAPGGGFTGKALVLNNGQVGLMGAAPLVGTGSSLEIGTLVGNSSLRWLGAAGNRYFLIDNSTGRLRLMMDNGAGGTNERLRVTNAGDVGIGTGADPSFRLQVNGGNATFGNATTGSLGVGTLAPSTRVHLKGTTGLLIEGPTNPPTTKVPYAMQATGTDLLISRESGSTGGATADEGISIVQNGSDYYIGICKSNPAYPMDVGLIGTAPAGNFGDWAVMGTPEDDSGLGWHMTLNGNGYTNSTSGWETISSVAIKTGIERLVLSEEQALLEKILRLPLYHYRTKQAGSEKERHIGFLAEEAPQEMVDDHFRGITPTDSLTTLLAAVKAQRAEIQTLEAEVDRLEKKEGMR